MEKAREEVSKIIRSVMIDNFYTLSHNIGH